MRPSRHGKTAAAVLLALAAAAVLLGWRWQQADARAGAAAGSGRGPAPTMAGTASSSPGSPGAPFSASGLAERERQLSSWRQRYIRAEQIYSSYRDATRYPPESRPLADHPDQARPFAPVVEEVALRDASGQPLPDLKIRTTQDRIFVTGAEAARFTLEALDADGRAVPVQLKRSVARTLPDSKLLVALVQAEVPFTDDGMGADDVPGDGKYSALLAPATQGFANQTGTIRLLVELSAGTQQGMVAFDVVYTAAAPATWAGAREALEDGGLNFYLKAQVKNAGRYVVTARVQDAAGEPFALLQFNDVVPAGAAEFKLPLAGVLVHDKQPVFPLRLVDVEGFLLQPDTFPDRAMMSRQTGVAYTSRSYGLDSFSAAEWQGEQRQRYLREYGKDVSEALEAMARLGAR